VQADDGAVVMIKLDKPNQIFIGRARELRKNSTLSEVLLWNQLKNGKLLGLNFNRQKVVNNRYIVDFFCPECNLIVEIDGRSHDNSKYKYDIERHNYLEELGFIVVRIDDINVKKSTEKVLERLKGIITTAPSSACTSFRRDATPSPARGNLDHASFNQSLVTKHENTEI